VAKIPKTIDAMFENSSSPTKTETEKEMQNGFISMLGNVKFALKLIVGAIVFLILLISGNTMAMSARERVTEIAVLRTLGFQKRTILGLVLGESLFLSLLGGVFGIGVFILFFPGFKQAIAMSPMGGFSAGMKLFPEVLAFAFGMTLLVGVVSGIVPAVRSAMRPITDGLRQVG
jgi:putative ABC transport system permease protein